MRIRLNKAFYGRAAVEAALDDFDQVCAGRIINSSMEVELEPKAETGQPLDMEFCNYVLGLMRNMA